jgi:hypothetical protein
MTPRQLWFKKYIDECIASLFELNKLEDWIAFKDKAKELAIELIMNYGLTQ